MSAAIRYGLTCLWPSEMADQFYCEYKVHLRRSHPEVVVELPALEWGEVSHAGLVSVAEPITPEEIEKAIKEGKELALCEWTLEGSFRGALIRGRPDFFGFRGKRARTLLDFKFTGGGRPFPDQVFQVSTYALLAAKMGFKVNNLCLGVVKFPRHGVGGNLREVTRAKAELLLAFQADGTLFRVIEGCERGRDAMEQGAASEATVEGDGWIAYLFCFNRPKAEKELDRALGFWLKEREPIPERRYPKKCFACPYNAAGLCEHALKPADDAFQVTRASDGVVRVIRTLPAPAKGPGRASKSVPKP